MRRRPTSRAKTAKSDIYLQLTDVVFKSCWPANNPGPRVRVAVKCAPTLHDGAISIVALVSLLITAVNVLPSNFPLAPRQHFMLLPFCFHPKACVKASQKTHRYL